MNSRKLTDSILTWYETVRRDLPWRADKDPYRIWVSEVMLQQTRVETVIPYYQRFIRVFPDMAALAAAPEEEVLAAWQGLGYYSRARHLQKGVREVVAHYGGKAPETRDEMMKIPGVGTYTAGAILSIALDQPEPAVDGNVLRVFSRFLHIAEPMEQAASRRQVEDFVRLLLMSSSRCGDITQALMELGALVCVPRNPCCTLCPWTDDCVALARQAQGELPKKAPAKTPRTVRIYTGVLLAEGQVLAVKRPAGGILAGMWEFPSVEEASSGPAEDDLAYALVERFRKFGQNIDIGPEWRSLTHTFSHREWRMRVFFCNALQLDFSVPDGVLWLKPQAMGKIIWAGPHRKLAVQVENELKRDQERRF